MDLPKPFWQILKRDTPPKTYWDFGTGDLVPVAAANCGCLLVRSKEHTCARLRSDGEYKCSVCEQRGGRNRQECWMLEQVKRIVHARSELYVICVQLPLHGTRCDVVLIPLHASAVTQLVVIELDGTDHQHKPRQYGLCLNDSFNAVAQRDSHKATLVKSEGMQFMRVRWCDMAAGHQAWTKHLHAMLDTHVVG